MSVELFGAIAVSCMALFYALEPRGPIYVFLFALACLASSLYAMLIASWPFSVIEFLWAGLAFRRFQKVRLAR